MGLRPRRGNPGNREILSLATVFCIAVLACSVPLTEGNRLPKFPIASKANRDDKDALKSSSTRTVQSEGTDKEENKTSILAIVGKAANNTADGGSIADLDKSLQDQWKIAGTQSDTSKSAGTQSDLSNTVLVKARLKPNDILQKGGKKKDPHAKLLSGGKHSHEYNYTEHRVQRSGILDIVVTHYDLARTEEMVNYWLAFLQMEKVQALKPYVFIYCQNEKYDLDEEDFRPILQLGGEIQHLPNIGRESHGYLEHITKRYNELADYTLFAQDQSDIDLPERFEMLFEQGRTGFLPLSLVGHVECDDPFLPAGVIPQIYAMFASELCPPVGYTSSFQGQFVVSKTRIQRNSWWTYQRLMDVLSADESHWIHQTHDNQHYKSKSNPMFGHVLERTWSVAFDCFESWREGNCWQCIVVQGMHNCGEGDCQCFDKKS